MPSLPHPRLLEKSRSDAIAAAPRAWSLAAWISGVFSALVGVVLLFGHLDTPTIDFLNAPELRQAKEKLQLNPADEPAKKQLRQLDLDLRQQYFRQLSRTRSGAYLLLGGAAVFVFAIRQAARYKKRMPMPESIPDAARISAHATTLARWSVALTGSVVGAFLFLVCLSFTTALPNNAAEVEKLAGSAAGAPAQASDAAPPAELKMNWPRFRGPEGSGVSPFTNLPASWDVKSGAGIAWKVPAPADGFNSPIVWGERVFFSGGDAARREVFCLDAKTGQTLWRQPVMNVPGSPAQPPEIPETTGYAAGSMATDGRRVYVSFANGDLAAFTLEGKPVWSKSFGPLKNPYGHAASLATWQDRLIVQLDQGESEDNKSKLYALDGRTGQVAWQHPRKVGSSWASPIIFEAAGKGQIVALAVPDAIAYSATDGTELWRLNGLNGEITPSPAFAAGLVLVISPSEKLFAIRPDGQGDVTKTGVAWSTEDNVPDVTSPVGNNEFVFLLTTPGLLTCLEARDGKKIWEHDFDMECHASPSLAGNRLYLFSQKGTAVVVEAARQFKELFRTDMGDAFHASPAFLPDRIIMRGVTNVWCLGPAPAK